MAKTFKGEKTVGICTERSWRTMLSARTFPSPRETDNCSRRDRPIILLIRIRKAIPPTPSWVSNSDKVELNDSLPSWAQDAGLDPYSTESTCLFGFFFKLGVFFGVSKTCFQLNYPVLSRAGSIIVSKLG